MRKSGFKNRFFARLFLFDAFEIVYNVAYGDEVVYVVVVDVNGKGLLATHYKLCKLNGVNAKVARQLCVKGYLVFLDLKLVNEKRFELFKHCVILQ